LECQENSKNGFVRFRGKSESNPVHSVTVPEHLRASMPDPLQHFSTEKQKASETSADHAATAKQLQEEVDRLDAERLARMQALLAKQRLQKAATSAPPPPPTMSFGAKRRK
jgi:hypothetical protein